MVAPASLDGAVSRVPPTLEPGCCVGRSVPDVRGRLFDGCVVDSLDAPAGGFCVVVSEFWAKAGPAASRAAANMIIFIGVISIPEL